MQPERSGEGGHFDIGQLALTTTAYLRAALEYVRTRRVKSVRIPVQYYVAAAELGMFASDEFGPLYRRGIVRSDHPTSNVSYSSILRTEIPRHVDSQRSHEAMIDIQHINESDTNPREGERSPAVREFSQDIYQSASAPVLSDGDDDDRRSPSMNRSLYPTGDLEAGIEQPNRVEDLRMEIPITSDVAWEDLVTSITRNNTLGRGTVNDFGFYWSRGFFEKTHPENDKQYWQFLSTGEYLYFVENTGLDPANRAQNYIRSEHERNKIAFRENRSHFYLTQEGPYTRPLEQGIRSNATLTNDWRSGFLDAMHTANMDPEIVLSLMEWSPFTDSIVRGGIIPAPAVPDETEEARDLDLYLQAAPWYTRLRYRFQNMFSRLIHGRKTADPSGTSELVRYRSQSSQMRHRAGMERERRLQFHRMSRNSRELSITRARRMDVPNESYNEYTRDGRAFVRVPASDIFGGGESHGFIPVFVEGIQEYASTLSAMTTATRGTPVLHGLSVRILAEAGIDVNTLTRTGSDGSPPGTILDLSNRINNIYARYALERNRQLNELRDDPLRCIRLAMGHPYYDYIGSRTASLERSYYGIKPVPPHEYCSRNFGASELLAKILGRTRLELFYNMKILIQPSDFSSSHSDPLSSMVSQIRHQTTWLDLFVWRSTENRMEIFYIQQFIQTLFSVMGRTLDEVVSSGHNLIQNKLASAFEQVRPRRGASVEQYTLTVTRRSGVITNVATIRISIQNILGVYDEIQRIHTATNHVNVRVMMLTNTEIATQEELNNMYMYANIIREMLYVFGIYDVYIYSNKN